MLLKRGTSAPRFTEQRALLQHHASVHGVGLSAGGLETAVLKVLKRGAGSVSESVAGAVLKSVVSAPCFSTALRPGAEERCFSSALQHRASA